MATLLEQRTTRTVTGGANYPLGATITPGGVNFAVYSKHASDVFLLTSRNEGTPVALIESLAAAVPGVSTDVGGVRDVIDSDRVGLLAPFGDARALAEQVQTLLADRDRSRRMGEAGRQAVSSRYGLDRLIGDVERLYRELLH